MKGGMSYALVGKSVSINMLSAYCQQAKDEGWSMVNVPPCYFMAAKKLLRGSGIKVYARVGYPHGEESVRAKVFEAADDLSLGADGISYYVNESFLEEGSYALVYKELLMLYERCKENVRNIDIVCPKFTSDKSRDYLSKMTDKLSFNFVIDSTDIDGYGPHPAAETTEEEDEEVTPSDNQALNKLVDETFERVDKENMGTHEITKVENKEKKGGVWLTLKKIVWIIFFGLGSAIYSIFAMIACFVSLIFIPIGIQWKKFIPLTFQPYGKRVVRGNSTGKSVINIIWAILGGWENALGYCIMGILCFVSIIFIPQGKQCFKLASFVIWPVGTQIVAD